MLVLQRTEQETILITHPDGTVITVQVLRVIGRYVRLGLTAPAEVKILRGEVEDRDAGR